MKTLSRQCAHARSLQSCLTLCDPTDSVCGILQWSGLPCPSPRDLPSPEIEPGSFMSLAVSGGFFTIRATEEGEEIVSSSHLCIFDGASSLPDGDEILH